MLTKRYNFPIVSICFIIFFTYSCVQEKVENPHEAAMPHRHMKASPRLSDTDRKDLAQSKGRGVKPLTYTQLANRLEFANGRIYIFQFWKLNCQTCRKINQHLKQFQTAFGEEKIALIYINMDKKTLENEVNTHIREDGLIGDIFQMESPEDLTKNELWYTELPAMYVVDNDKSIKFFYQQDFTYDELVAVMQPLIL